VSDPAAVAASRNTSGVVSTCVEFTTNNVEETISQLYDNFVADCLSRFYCFGIHINGTLDGSGSQTRFQIHS